LGLNWRVVVAFLLGLSLFPACAATFPYRHWSVHLEEGRLIGAAEDGSDDRDLGETCRKDANGKRRCTLMLNDEFYPMKKEYLRLKAGEKP
jgi:hypothetical protein